MKIIQLGQFHKKLLIPIIGGIFLLIYRFIRKANPKNKVALKNPFILNIYVSFGMIIAFIPYLILKYKNKEKHVNNPKNIQINSKLNIELIYAEDYKVGFSGKYLLIFFSEIFDFSQIILFNMFSYNCIYNFWTLDILFMSILCCFLLKTHLYRHQYFSIFIIIISGLILNILEYYKQADTNELKPLEISMSILSELCLSLSMVLVKYNMEKTFCSPYEICIWEGALALIFNTIILLIINKLGLIVADIQYPDNFYDLFGDYDIYDFLLCLTIVLGNAVYNLVLFTTCNYFTPCHILITSIIIELQNSLETFEKTGLNIISFLILILITFMFLVYIEIIELNIFNISYNTKKNIELRSLEESIIGFDFNINPTGKKHIDEEETSNSSFSISNNNSVNYSQ